ncbi:MAG: hypothetical protein B193_1577 [Solidesulfovibrio magneticus str. Maddingley MBC34]|uniref:Uncharacterized protein n=1 Tax=Solidesulfovibrio magneticus str. Maddingley MBC34 TaxID=1206767 RepID=K6FMB3_9BACT|nr:MAG: hypothetical protein B193_1577 [Solidesulfovibrio magneticus str. Maddingley MBC34]
MADTIYQGDVGLEILVDCGRDLTGAASPTLRVRLPSGATRTWPAAVAGSGQDAAKLRYVTRSGDLAEAGVYKLQAVLTLGDWSGGGRTASFTVRPQFS